MVTPTSSCLCLTSSCSGNREAIFGSGRRRCDLVRLPTRKLKTQFSPAKLQFNGVAGQTNLVFHYAARDRDPPSRGPLYSCEADGARAASSPSPIKASGRRPSLLLI